MCQGLGGVLGRAWSHLRHYLGRGVHGVLAYVLHASASLVPKHTMMSVDAVLGDKGQMT